jgi:dTDP-4-amino-4,6-dideoxygalactose transaminase
MPAYRHLPHSPLPVTEQASREILSIPVHDALTDAEVDRVIEALNGLAN